MNVSADPGGQLLVSGGFGISVGTRAQHHHEQRRWPDFAGNRIVYRDRGTGPVHETLLARLVYLAKNYILLPTPTLVEPAEATVAVPFRMHLPVFFPSRSEEHTSELQSQSNLVCRLLLEKKKKKQTLQCSSIYR